jgi:hypothetical protein
VAIDLPDVNVWLALAVQNHPQHKRARRFWNDESADQLAFCRNTMLGFLRLTTNNTVMSGSPLTVAQSWNAYVALRSAPEVLLAHEPASCEGALQALALADSMVPRMWTDAYLAAFAISAGMRLVTFDNDFSRFSGLNLLQL